EQAQTLSTQCLWLDWQEQDVSLASLRAYLSEKQPRLLGIRHVPNARLLSDACAQDMLAGEQETLRSVGELREALQVRAEGLGLDPRAFWALEQDVPYRVVIRWSLNRNDGSLHLLFWRREEQPAVPFCLSPDELQYLRSRPRLANNPGQRQAFFD